MTFADTSDLHVHCAKNGICVASCMSSCNCSRPLMLRLTYLGRPMEPELMAERYGWTLDGARQRQAGITT